MKAFLALSLALVVLTPVQAQVFRPGVGRDARHGGSRDGGRGHVVGPRHYSPHGGYVYRHGPSLYWGIRPVWYGGYYPAYSYYPGYSVVDYPYYGSWGHYGSTSAASTGFWLGALAGGIIGHNSGDFRHNGWRGAAWGAGAGWLLGSVIDANRRPVYYAPAATVTYPPAASAPAPAAPAATAAPQQVTIINNYYNSSSPMSGANNLFGR